MKIKTFQALTMSDAIRSIKEELGPEAVILSSKQVRKGGGIFGLFGRTMVEVAAAVDIDTGGRRKGQAVKPAAEPARRDERKPASRPAWGETGKAAASYDATGRRPAPRVESRRPDPVREALPRWDQEEADFDAHLRDQIEQPAPSTPEWRRVQEEIQDLRRLVETNLGGGARKAPAGQLDAGQRMEPEEAAGEAGGSLAAWRRRLLDAGLEAATVMKVIKEAQQRLSSSELPSEPAIRQALHRALVRDVKVGGPLVGLGEWKKTVIFTGPTGVGKTTTIAKLAAHYRLKEKRSVALITLDTYRVAAVEQLRMYANVIGVTMDVALTKREALDCIRRRSKAELILIDTAGRSPRDEAGMEELRQLVALDHPLETHLVLSAGTRERDLQDGIARYGGMPIDRLLFTKLDETSGFGGVFDLMVKTGLPLSYLSTGQRVPEDLEVARPERLADLLLDGELKTAAKGVKREERRLPTNDASRDARHMF